MEWLKDVALLLTVVGSALSIVISGRNVRKTSPVMELKGVVDDHASYIKDLKREIVDIKGKDIDDRLRKIEATVEKDDNRLTCLAEATQSQQRFLIMLLRTDKIILQHLSSGNAVMEVNAISAQIDDFLLKEASIAVNGI